MTPPPFSLADRVAVVTGASRGIGRAIVQLTQEGKTQLRRLRTAWPAAVFCWDAESISPEPLLEPAKQNWITSNSARFETPSLRLAIEKKLKWPWRVMTAVVNAYDNHMSMSEQVLKKDNVKAGLKEILKDLVYEAFAKARPEVDMGA